MSWYFDRVDLSAAGCMPVTTISEARRVGRRPDLDSQNGRDILSRLGETPIHPIFSHENFSASSYRYFRVENLYRQYAKKTIQASGKAKDKSQIESLPVDRKDLPRILEHISPDVMRACPTEDMDWSFGPAITEESEQQGMQRPGRGSRATGVRKPLSLEVYNRMKPALQLASLMIENSYPWFFRVVQAGERGLSLIESDKTMKEIWSLSHVDPESPVSPRHFHPGVPNALQYIVDTTFFFFSDGENDGGGVDHRGLEDLGAWGCACPVDWGKLVAEEEQAKEDEQVERRHNERGKGVQIRKQGTNEVKFAIELEGTWLRKMTSGEWVGEQFEMEHWKGRDRDTDWTPEGSSRYTTTFKRAVLFHLATTLTHEVCHRMYMALSAILNTGSIWETEPFWKRSDYANEAGASWENWFFGGLPNDLAPLRYSVVAWATWENSTFQSSKWFWGDGTEGNIGSRPGEKTSVRIGGGPSIYALTTRCIQNFFNLDCWNEQFGPRKRRRPKITAAVLQHGLSILLKPRTSGSFVKGLGWFAPGLWLELAPFRMYERSIGSREAFNDYDESIKTFYLKTFGRGQSWIDTRSNEKNTPRFLRRNPTRRLVPSQAISRRPRPSLPTSTGRIGLKEGDGFLRSATGTNSCLTQDAEKKVEANPIRLGKGHKRSRDDHEEAEDCTQDAATWDSREGSTSTDLEPATTRQPFALLPVRAPRSIFRGSTAVGRHDSLSPVDGRKEATITTATRSRAIIPLAIEGAQFVGTVEAAGRRRSKRSRR